MKTAKVLFLHKWFSLSGGVERVHKNLSTALAGQNVPSEFYVFDTLGSKKAGFEQLKSERKASSPPQEVNLLRKISHLVSFIKTNQITVIIAATETANMLALACAMRFPSIKVIFTRHCAFDVSDQKLSPRSIKFLYNLYSLAGGSIVAVSRDLQNQIKDNVVLGNKRIEFIPNAVIDSRVDQLAYENSDDFAYTRYFCAVGRLVEQKGFDLLIEAYAQAKAMHSDLPELVIVGIGEDLEKLTALRDKLDLTNVVHFFGYTTNPYYIIRNAEAFILSSRHEGMPTALIEAMHLNTPVIAFDCPTGPAELIIDSENGFLVEANHIGKLAQAIVDYQKLQSLDISHHVQDFHFERVAQKYIAQFEG